jgi:UDP:flavonoid glycosyltransferase YjiC (YdhE family)
MASFLFSALGAKGHLHPLIAVAKELQAGGHPVAFYTSSHYRELIESLGFKHLPPKRWRDFDFANFEQYWGELTEVSGTERAMQIYLKIFAGTAATQAVDLHNYITVLKPDMLVSEPTALGTNIINAKFNLPFAVFNFSLRPLWLPLIGFKQVKPDLCLVQGLECLGVKDDSNGVKTHYVGACLWDESNAAPPLKLPVTELPLVYVSLGTVFARADFFRKVINASSGQAWHIIITTSHKINPAIFEPLPQNVSVYQYIPHSQLLHLVSAMVTTGAASHILGALKHGVPLVLGPLEADHAPNAEAVIRAEAGLSLDLINGSETEIAKAIQEVLENPLYRQASQNLQIELNKLDGAKEAASRLLLALANVKAPHTSGSLIR